MRLARLPTFGSLHLESSPVLADICGLCWFRFSRGRKSLSLRHRKVQRSRYRAETSPVQLYYESAYSFLLGDLILSEGNPYALRLLAQPNAILLRRLELGQDVCGAVRQRG